MDKKKFNSKVSKMGKKKMINIPKENRDDFESGDEVTVEERD